MLETVTKRAELVSVPVEKVICVVGLGHIGLPLAMTFCERGYSVIGVDVDSKKIQSLLAGRTDVLEDYNGQTLEDLLRHHTAAGKFVPTTHLEDAAAKTNRYVVTVGLPVCLFGDVNYSPMLAAMRDIGKVLKAGDLVLVRGTLVPGTSTARLIPLLEERSGLTVGQDFHYAYASERVAEGRAMVEFQTLDVVMGGITEGCATRAAELLSTLTDGAIHVTDIVIAEAAKVVENLQRDVNVALVNQVEEYCRQLNIDVYELIRVANTHPRVNLLQPGIGVGGYCIPNAFHYVAAAAGVDMDKLPLLALARQVNRDRPMDIVDRLAQLYKATGRPLEHATVAILGVGMKENSNDLRQSPTLDVIEALIQRGAFVRVFDPLVESTLPWQSPTLESCLYRADGLIVAAWHDAFHSVDFSAALTLSLIGSRVIDLKGHLRKYRYLLDDANSLPQNREFA